MTTPETPTPTSKPEDPDVAQVQRFMDELFIGVVLLALLGITNLIITSVVVPPLAEWCVSRSALDWWTDGLRLGIALGLVIVFRRIFLHLGRRLHLRTPRCNK